MRLTGLLGVACFSLVVACGGAVAPTPEKQGSDTGGTGTGSGSGSERGSGGATGSGGASGSGSSSPGAFPQCTPGTHVFCSCADAQDGTMLCRNDGTFDACVCSDVDCFGPNVPPNPAGCPPVYSHALHGTVCPELGIVCSYPGQGDGKSPGECPSTAGLICTAAEEGTARWVAVQ